MAHAASIAAETSAPARAQTRAEAGRWEMAAASLCLAQFSEPFFSAVAAAQGADEPPGYARLAFAPVYLFLAWALMRAPGKALRTALSTPLLMSLLALAFVSTLWSIDSGGTLRRSVWLALTMLFSLYLAWRYDWPRLVRVLAGAFVVLAAGSFALAVLMPSAGIMPEEHPGAWSGLWTHKNTLGGIMALGAPICAAAAIVAPARRRFWLAMSAACFMLVLLSTSKTALVATLLGFAVMAAASLMRRGPTMAVVIGVGAAGAVLLGGSIFLFAPEIIVSALGRDATLTGRTDIWQHAAPAVAAQPWLGYGYYAFWLPDNGPAYWVRQAVQWPVSSAHSSWLELALGLGRIGVWLFALQLIATSLRGLGVITQKSAGLWAPAFLAAFALYTVSESHALQANNLFWAIYVAVAARLTLDAREQRKSA